MRFYKLQMIPDTQKFKERQTTGIVSWSWYISCNRLGLGWLSAGFFLLLSLYYIFNEYTIKKEKLSSFYRAVRGVWETLSARNNFLNNSPWLRYIVLIALFRLFSNVGFSTYYVSLCWKCQYFLVAVFLSQCPVFLSVAAGGANK